MTDALPAFYVVSRMSGKFVSLAHDRSDTKLTYLLTYSLHGAESMMLIYWEEAYIL